MESLILDVTPESAFGTPLVGDTLFGQLCWALRHRFGMERLEQILQGYTEADPFLVVSDAFPRGYVPRPALPLHRFRPVPGEDRKQVRKRRWLPLEHIGEEVADWLLNSVPDAAAGQKVKEHTQLHNSIDRRTGTTGNGFAPYAMSQHWYQPGVSLDIHIRFDPVRIAAAELVLLLSDIGQAGYGRDASIGLGRFHVQPRDVTLSSVESPNALLTLAASAPLPGTLDTARCWYEPVTRFGRHGSLSVHTGRPFKSPVLSLRAGALLTPQGALSADWVGQGLGGLRHKLSNAGHAAVHQGYAPVVPVRFAT